jgi:four helix bundle protein
MSVQTYRDLEVWQFSMDLVEQCYRLSRKFPKEELFGITSQIRRAAVSVPSNIAEGQGRDHTREFLKSLSIARGSLMELETQLLICVRIDLLYEDAVKPQLDRTDRISRMLTGLRKALEKRL